MSNYPSKDTLKTEMTMEHDEERNCTPEKKAIYQKIKDKCGLNKEHTRNN